MSQIIDCYTNPNIASDSTNTMLLVSDLQKITTKIQVNKKYSIRFRLNTVHRQLKTYCKHHNHNYQFSFLNSEHTL